MRRLLLLGSVLLLSACGSKGPPVPDWKTDSANYIERYKPRRARDALPKPPGSG